MTLPGFERGPLWVLDSSAAINFIKKLVPEELQSEFWSRLLALVRQGQLVFPSQVWSEIGDVENPDALAQWARDARSVMGHLPAPDDATVSMVVQDHPDILESRSGRDPADPYVIALALEHARDGYAASVVADDGGDRATHGMRKACEDFGIPCVMAADFVARVFPQARA